ncbi:MAG: ABC transporter permease [Rhodospirillaceae bacterium]|nr:ABC transporter permease [Rhodospirillaceae bacterium]
MTSIYFIFKRELATYFLTPVAYIFLVIFLAALGSFTFFLGSFFTRGQADLQVFFSFHPWVYLFLIPAIGMRLWSEERKTGTIELLMTLPITTFEIVIAKFLAAWFFSLIALCLTFPMWISVNILGSPDNGVILASYIGSFLMSGALIALVSCISASTKSQVIAFILSVSISFIFLMAGLDIILSIFKSWAPPTIINIISSLSILSNFQQITKGVIDLREVIFFISMILGFLFVNKYLIEFKKSK